jgi:hypothetical protein
MVESSKVVSEEGRSIVTKKVVILYALSTLLWLSDDIRGPPSKTKSKVPKTEGLCV